MISTPARRLLGGLASSILAVSLAACGGTAAPATPAPASTVPTSAPVTSPPSASPTASAAATAGASLATSGRIAFPDKKFAVTLPEGWTRIDLSAGDLDALLAAAGASNPDLAEAYSAQIKAMLATGLVLFAFGPDPSQGTNVNILVAPSFGVSLDLLEQANLAQIKQMADGEVVSERVTLPAGQAIHMRYAIAAAGQPVAPSIEQYYIVTDESQYIVSVTNADAAAAASMAQSIELLD
jgi:hypothetical protein